MKNESAGKKTNEILKDISNNLKNILKELGKESINNKIGSLVMTALTLTQFYFAALTKNNPSFNIILLCSYIIMMTLILIAEGVLVYRSFKH